MPNIKEPVEYPPVASDETDHGASLAKTFKDIEEGLEGDPPKAEGE